MGILTTLTIRNDGLDQILKQPSEFMELLNGHLGGGRAGEYGIGNHTGLVKIHQPRSTHNSALYVHKGGTVCDLTPYGAEAERLMRENPAFFNDMISYMEKSIAQLKQQAKDMVKTT